MSEHTEQANTVTWFTYQYPSLSELLFSIPNGAHLSGSVAQRGAQMNKLKKEGLKTGIQDLMLAYPHNGYSGLFLEMKDEGKTESSLSKDQKKYNRIFAEVGYKTAWAAGFEEAKAIIKEYLCDS